MKKTLRFSLLSMLMMLCGNVMAQTVFDFDADGINLLGLPGESNSESQNGDITEAKTATVGAFSVTVSAAAEGQKAPNRLWDKAPKLRLYGGSLTIASATDDIKAVEFTLATTASSAKWGADNAASTGTLDASAKTVVKWTGQTRELVINISANTQISKITINGESGETPVDPQPDPADLTGDGTLANPYTPADANQVASLLASGAVSEQDYYIKGKVSSIKYTFSAQFGTATFFISADGTAEGEQFQCYSVLYLENKSWVDGNTQIAVGDDVIICGRLTNYNGNTPETAAKKAYIFSLNGVTENEGGNVTPPDPVTEQITVAKALEIIDGLEAGKTTAETYQVKGYVISVTEISAAYGNATFVMADSKTAETGLTVFRIKGFDGENITSEDFLKVGDEVVIEAKLQKYVKGENVIPETVQNGSKIISVNGKTTDTTTPVDPVIETISVEQALDIITEDLEDGKTTATNYYVKGFVVGAPEFQRKADTTLYGNANFLIADEKDGEPTLTVFRAKSYDNQPFNEETISLLKDGDEVVVCGKLQRYVKDETMTPELSSCYIYSINGKTSGIATVKMNAATGNIYNLQGQRVAQPTRGLYIIDGRKVMVK